MTTTPPISAEALLQALVAKWKDELATSSRPTSICDSQKREDLAELHAALAAAKTAWEAERAKGMWFLTDDRLRALMEQVGMPNSRSLYQAFKQLENEVHHYYTTPQPSPQQAADTRTANLESLARFGPQQAHATTDAAQGEYPYRCWRCLLTTLSAAYDVRCQSCGELLKSAGIVVPPPAEQQASSEGLACGHHKSLAVFSAERPGVFLYCDLCDTRERRNDAERTERELREQLVSEVDAHGKTVMQLAAALNASTLPAGDEGMRRDAERWRSIRYIKNFEAEMMKPVELDKFADDRIAKRAARIAAQTAGEKE